MHLELVTAPVRGNQYDHHKYKTILVLHSVEMLFTKNEPLKSSTTDEGAEQPAGTCKNSPRYRNDSVNRHNFIRSVFSVPVAAG